METSAETFEIFSSQIYEHKARAIIRELSCNANDSHVDAAKHYLNHFHGEVVIKCEVNPKDCVSCPFDYNFAKLRTCKYKVVEDVTNQFSY